MTRPKRRPRKPRRRATRGGEAGAPPLDRAQPAAVTRESVEDPLDDWEQDDADRWVLDRHGEDVQRNG